MISEDNDKAFENLESSIFALDPMTAIKELDRNIAKTVESILVRIDTMEKLLAKTVNTMERVSNATEKISKREFSDFEAASNRINDLSQFVCCMRTDMGNVLASEAKLIADINSDISSVEFKIADHTGRLDKLTKVVNSLVENSLFGKPAVVTNAQVEKIRRAKVDTSPGSNGMTFDETESRRPTEITFTAAEVYELQQIVYWAESNALDKALDLNISWGAAFDLMDEWHEKRPATLNPATKKKLYMVKDPS